MFLLLIGAFKLKKGPLLVIASFLVVMLGALLSGSQIQEPGITPMQILGYSFMIQGNLIILRMIKEQNRPPQNNKAKNNLDA